jgi:hypothetical protein
VLLNADVALDLRLKPGNGTQNGGFAATRRTKNNCRA